ncbi:SAV_6107 family HEPN domain-containing protein [uncultured Corynebacterium sp.]|uniref:SAV_6107 family HEPN domain-containing protein n=1 Tax=uncultured Corynebacterium sp. TaxID=159447 RepID=UPI0025944826|nr:SAV_6107 family HEPN domain-containing protein [uncultured Corynebacterium sp.]
MSTVRKLRAHTVHKSAVSFLDDAERQLAASRQAERLDEALSLSYRAALRAAGALIEHKMAGRKRRPQGSAWDKLKMLDPAMEQRCQRFEVHARLASRADMGLEKNVNPLVVQKLYDQACVLVDEARAEIEGAAVVA